MLAQSTLERMSLDCTELLEEAVISAGAALALLDQPGKKASLSECSAFAPPDQTSFANRCIVQSYLTKQNQPAEQVFNLSC